MYKWLHPCSTDNKITNWTRTLSAGNCLQDSSCFHHPLPWSLLGKEEGLLVTWKYIKAKSPHIHVQRCLSRGLRPQLQGKPMSVVGNINLPASVFSVLGSQVWASILCIVAISNTLMFILRGLSYPSFWCVSSRSPGNVFRALMACRGWWRSCGYFFLMYVLPLVSRWALPLSPAYSVFRT